VGHATAAAATVGLSQAAAYALHTLLVGTADAGFTGCGPCCCTLPKQALLALLAASATTHNTRGVTAHVAAALLARAAHSCATGGGACSHTLVLQADPVVVAADAPADLHVFRAAIEAVKAAPASRAGTTTTQGAARSSNRHTCRDNHTNDIVAACNNDFRLLSVWLVTSLQDLQQQQRSHALCRHMCVFQLPLTEAASAQLRP
jgi:hypothetical protein